MTLSLAVFLKLKVTGDIGITHSLTNRHNPSFNVGTSHSFLHMFLKGFDLLGLIIFDVSFSLLINGHFS